jgi:molybdate transport system regulatory protein
MTKSIKKILRKDGTYKVTGTLWIERDGERFFGPGRAELLEHIAETGSINMAARKMGMSYKKAWEMINALNNQSGKPIVIPKTGGEKGGGTTLSEEAWELIAYHRTLRERFLLFLKTETDALKK